ncbi:DUF11 domain-containing protein [Pontibacter sp. JH31]|uniref:DUF11 domain-containing protein n=1 Tax=Pontibacter aquaedesilientis TaxID=2766980 RepID=A0ABR7XFZ2_9BACT|nr:ice-binding family protein [Pontibacter aquaedesilientis]MBD1397212.1 DUF11 domain-containing protein [Pontibacter aquaedesilientis]
MSRILLLLILLLTTSITHSFGQSEISLGRANRFIALANKEIIVEGPDKTWIRGDIGTSPSKLITGENNLVVTGKIEKGTELAAEAMSDIRRVYQELRMLPADASLNNELGNGREILPGVYHINGNATINDISLLVGQGASNPVFIFVIDGNLTANPGSLSLSGLGVESKNIYWVVNGNVDIRTPSTLYGNVIATGDVRFGKGVNLYGRAFSLDGKIIFDTNSTVLENVTNADLVVDKVVDNKDVSLGSRVTYTITAINNGPGVAHNVVVKEHIPSGLKFLEAKPASKGTYNQTANEWVIGDMEVGEQQVIKLVFQIISAGNIVNEVIIIGNNPDPKPGDEEKEEEIILPDLGLTKKILNPKDSYNLGDVVAYEIKVANNASTVQANINVREQLAEGLEYVRHEASVGTTYNKETGIYNIPTLAGNTSATLVVYAKIVAVGSIRNVATIIGRTPDNDKDPDNNEQEVEIELPDLGLTKTIVDRKDDYKLGDVVAYEIKVTNNAKTAQANINVREQLAEGLEYVRHEASAGTTYNKETGIYNIPTLAGNTSATLVVYAKIVAVGSIRNVATIIGRTPDNDKDPDNNEQEVEIELPDLGLTKTIVDRKDDYKLGDVVAYEIKVTNNAKTAQANVNVREQLAEGLEYVRHEASAGTTYNKETGIYNIPTLAGNTTATLVVYAKIVAVGSIRNVATIIGRTPDNDKDPDNNEQEVEIELPDLGLTKTIVDQKDSYKLGDVVVYEIKVTNYAKGAQNNVNVAEVLAEGLEYIRYEASVGTYNHSTGIYNIPTLAGKTAATLRVFAKLVRTGNIRNVATIKDRTPDNDKDPDNNEEEVEIVLPDLGVTKQLVSTQGEYYVGDMVQYKIVVTNYAKEQATNVKVEEKLPEGLLYVSHQVNRGEYNQSTGMFTIPVLAIDAPAVLTITAQVVKSGSIRNIVSIIGKDPVNPTDPTDPGDYKDSDPDNDDDEVVVPVGCRPNVEVTIGTAPTAVCINTENLTFKATSNVIGGTYKWDLPAGWRFAAGSGQGSNEITVIAGPTAGANKIKVTVTDQCKTNSATAEVTVDLTGNPTALSINGDNTVCFNGEGIRLTAPAVDGLTYKWTASVNLEIVGEDNKTNVTVKPKGQSLLGGKVYLTVTNSCGLSTTSEKLILVTPAPAALGAIKGKADLCEGEEVTFSIDEVVGATGYTWTIPTTAGWQVVRETKTSITVKVGSDNGAIRVTANNGCSSTSAVQLELKVTKLPTAPAIEGAATACAGDEVTYTVKQPIDGITYTWNVTGWTLKGAATGNSITVVAGSGAGNISVTASNRCDEASNSMTVGITPKPDSPGTISHDVNVCQNSAGNVISITEVPGATSYTWNLPEGWVITGGRNTNQITVTVNEKGGTVSVTADNCTGSSTPATITINITPPPAPVTRITDNSNVCEGLIYTADAVAGATSYTWTVTEGFTIESGQGTPTIKVKANSTNAFGRVSVMTHTGGCVGSAEFSMDIDAKVADGQLDFPKAFSPNGDGKNDSWLVKNLEKFPDNEMVIFNRWGSEVYKQKSYKNDWTATGLEQGTYFYKVRVKLCDGVYKEYTGYVTIFR